MGVSFISAGISAGASVGVISDSFIKSAMQSLVVICTSAAAFAIAAAASDSSLVIPSLAEAEMLIIELIAIVAVRVAIAILDTIFFIIITPLKLIFSFLVFGLLLSFFSYSVHLPFCLYIRLKISKRDRKK